VSSASYPLAGPRNRDGTAPVSTRVLMLNCEFPPIGGGAANATWHLLREFAHDSALKIDVVTSNTHKVFEEVRFSPNIRIFRLAVRKKSLHWWRMPEIASWSRQAYFFSRRLLSETKYDLCHCWFGWPSGVIGYMLRKRLPFLVALRGTDVPGYNVRLGVWDKIVFNRVSRLVWRNAAAVTANSFALKALAEKTCPEKEIEVIYNGVDAADPRRDRNGSGWSVLFVGRLIKRKGVDYLLEAFRRLPVNGRPVRLVIAGEGPERPRLEEYCRRTGLSASVSFVGAASRNELAALYREARLLVLPSLEESLANVVLEAMASGLPVVTTDTGAAEVVRGNGFVVERKSSEQISEAIRKYLEDPALLERHGRRSQAIAEMLSWTNVARSYRRLYDRITGRTSPSYAINRRGNG